MGLTLQTQLVKSMQSPKLQEGLGYDIYKPHLYKSQISQTQQKCLPSLPRTFPAAERRKRGK